MNMHRLGELVYYEIKISLLKRKGLLFLLPFFFFWYLVLSNFYDGSAASWIQSNEILMLLSVKFDMNIVSSLFLDNPPSLSVFYLFSLYTMPFFALLVANDMFASDLGNGYFRFLISRCHRLELFLARYLSTFLLTAISFALVGIVATAISIFTEGYEISPVIFYYAKILSILMLYIAPYLAFMAFISAQVNSAIAAIFLGMVSYTSILISIYIANAAFDTSAFIYLLPSSLKQDLLSTDIQTLIIAISTLPAYFVILASLAWLRFSKRSL